MARRNPAAVRALFAPGGPVARDLKRRGLRVQNLSKVYCPVDKGRLRGSIICTEPIRVANGLALQVGTNVVYSRAVHEGSGSPDAPRSWKVAHARGHPIPARRFLVNALPAGRG